MKVGIMQPYFLPYIGYWQLINAVDKFVILDDVNYIMRGYINRNEILLNGKRYRFTIPIKKASQNKLIMETVISYEIKKRKNFLRTVHDAYGRAPYYDKVFPIIEKIIMYEEDSLTRYIRNSLTEVMSYLSINTEVLLSSELQINRGLKSEEKIIEICKRVKGDIYINPSGGRGLYHKERFKKQGVDLYFLDVKKESIRYFQNQENFEELLSIIDILMFNDSKKIGDFLEKYSLSEI